MKNALMVAATMGVLVVPAAAHAQSMDDWTGFSVGIVGGASSIDDDDDETLVFDRNLDGTFGDTVTVVSGADAFSPGFCGGRAKGPAAGGGCQEDDDGVEAALRAGYDYQWGSFVVGAVAEISGAEAKDNVTGFSTTPASYTLKRSLLGTAAARARVGYAMGPTLVYATGGYARARIDNRFTTSNMTNQFSTTSDDEQDLDGWQAGGGIEYRLTPQLSVIGEYLYSSFDVDDDFVVRVGRGGAPATNPFILPPNVTGTDLTRSSDQFKTHAVRIGMAFRF